MKNILDALDVVSKVKKDNVSLEAYKIYKKLYVEKIKEDKANKNELYIQNANNPQKAIWKVINKHLNNNEKEKESNTLNSEKLNIFFSTVGEITTKEIPLTNKDANSYLNKKIDTTKSCCFFETTEHELLTIIAKIGDKKTQDIYGTFN